MKLFRHFGLAAVLLLAGCTSNSTNNSTSNTTSNTTTAAVLSFAAPFARSLDGGLGGATSGKITAIADFNGDGRLDFAVANPGTSSISVFLNSGGGGFNPELKFAGPAGGPIAIATGDFDGNGAIDIVGITANQVTYFLNNGAGSFPTHAEVAIGTDNRSLEVGDFDGDKNSDIAICDAAGNPVHMIFGDGTATVANYAMVDFTTSAGSVLAPLSIVKGDFNADGKLDFALANRDSDFLTIWLNAGGARAGLFPSGNTLVSNLGLPTGNRAQAVNTGDFNGDGRIDLCTASKGTNSATAQLMVNTAGGINNIAGQQIMSPNPQQVASGDFNQDGFLDLVVISANGLNNNGTGEADVFLGYGIGVLNIQVPYPGQTGKLLTSVSVGDFNGDGRPDILVAGPGQASVMINTSSPQ